MALIGPQILVDTNIVLQLGTSLTKQRAGRKPFDRSQYELTDAASALLDNRAFPSLVLTDAVGSEAFGKSGFSLNGGTTIVQGTDKDHKITLKPWDEVRTLLEKNGDVPSKTLPSGRSERIGMNAFIAQAEQEYRVLARLADNGKLVGEKLTKESFKVGRHETWDLAKSYTAHSFNGFAAQDAGEKSMAVAHHQLVKSVKSNLFVVTNDRHAIADFAAFDSAHPPQIMNLQDFLNALHRSGVLCSGDRDTISGAFEHASSTDVRRGVHRQSFEFIEASRSAPERLVAAIQCEVPPGSPPRSDALTGPRPILSIVNDSRPMPGRPVNWDR